MVIYQVVFAGAQVRGSYELRCLIWSMSQDGMRRNPLEREYPAPRCFESEAAALQAIGAVFDRRAPTFDWPYRALASQLRALGFDVLPDVKVSAIPAPPSGDTSQRKVQPAAAPSTPVVLGSSGQPAALLPRFTSADLSRLISLSERKCVEADTRGDVFALAFWNRARAMLLEARWNRTLPRDAA
jgi:hypothetical protein